MVVDCRAVARFSRHLTQHVGGFVMSRGPLARLVPVENTAMPERTVIQWDKDDLDAVGLMKVDVLALGMLSALRRMLDLLGERHGWPWRLDDIPSEDPATYEMLCHADSMGVFQVESRAQMAMLPRLRPRQYYDLVVEVALVRPGPIQGEMVHHHLKRRQGRGHRAHFRQGRCRSGTDLACPSFRNRSCNSPSSPPISRRARLTSCGGRWLPGDARGICRNIGTSCGPGCGKTVCRPNLPSGSPSRSRIWRIRLSRITCCQFRIAGPRLGLGQAPSSGYFPVRPAQQPAHGFLFGFPAGPGCPAAWRYRVAAGRGSQ